MFDAMQRSIVALRVDLRERMVPPISIVPTSPRVYWSELRSLVHRKPVDMEAVEGLIEFAPVELRHELRVYARANGWKSPKDERRVEEALARSGQDEALAPDRWVVGPEPTVSEFFERLGHSLTVGGR